MKRISKLGTELVYMSIYAISCMSSTSPKNQTKITYQFIHILFYIF